MKNNKLVIATGIYYPDIGGPATYSNLLASEFTKKGKEVVVVTYSDKKYDKFDKNKEFKVVRIKRGRGVFSKFIRYYRYYLAVKNEIKANAIVYAQDPVSSGLPAFLASKKMKKDFFLKVVGDYAWEQGVLKLDIKDDIFKFQSKKYSIFVGVLKCIERFVAKNAKIVIVPSEFLKKVVLTWGVKEEKLKVIRNSYNSSLNNKLTKKYSDKQILISVGRLVPWKGFKMLIEIMPDILKEESDAVLEIIGEGPDRKKLDNLIKRFGLENNVFLIGALSKDDLKKRLLLADVFVLNTAYEGLSHQILEVVDMEIPIITTNIGGNPEILKNNKSGILLNFNDKNSFKEQILRLLKDKNLSSYLTKNAKLNLHKFDKDTMIKNTYNTLFG